MSDRIKSILIGAFSGFLNGLFGSGGGTVVVPAVRKFLGISTHKSHATAISIILPLSIVSAVVYVKGSDIEWMPVLLTSSGGIAGGYIGAKLLSKISAGWLHKIFGSFMIAGAVRMIFFN